MRRELDRHSVTGPIVLVAHSYGAFVATLVAATDPRVAGLVLVDGNLASFMDDAQLERLLATYTPQFAALEQAAPELARVMIPVIEAYPATVERLREVDVPHDLPTVDIVAERTWVETPEEIDAIRRAHSRLRRRVTAASGRVCRQERASRDAGPARSGSRSDRERHRSSPRVTTGRG